MDFGIFVLMPQRDGTKPVGQAAQEALAQVRAAEEMGFGTAWFAEHHFSNYSLVPSPLTAAAWMAGHTSRIRLGTAVVVAPLYEPLRLLEDMAWVDQISGGRLSVGLGSGYQEHECRRFGVNLADCRAMLHEMMDLIEQAWRGEALEYKGRFYDLPRTALSVRPVQSPHPPLLVAGLTFDPDIQRRMARAGHMPFISAQWKPASEVLETRRHVEAHYREAGVDPGRLRLSVQRFVYVTEDRADALAAAEHLRYTYRIAHGFRQGDLPMDGHVIQSLPVQGEPSLEEIAERAIIGSPEKAAAQLVDEIRTLDPTHLSCVMQFGGLEIDKVKRSMELFGSKVLPALRRELGELSGYGRGGARAAAE